MPGEAILREVSLTLPMAPDMEIAASESAAEVAESMGLSADKIGDVRMAVVEACINAFEHSRSQEVHLSFAVVAAADGDDGQGGRLEITIRDTGVGFDPSEVEEPTIEEKLKADRKRGWGLKIMRGLMDDVEIHSGAEGTSIVMSKER
jgi:serine/threonine-protein kinase RsbW